MSNAISVIIPIYNVAAYLPQCLDSVLSQDHPHLQVILIDDGSSDSSGAICDEYAAKDSRVTVIHQKNAGAAAAKNAGLRIATGEYLSFVDSDDYLESGAYAHMLGLLRESGADVVQCGYRDVFTNKTVDHTPDSSLRSLTGTAFLARFTRDWTCALLWDKLYRRSLFDGIFFEEGHKIDDEYFTYQGIMNANSVIVDDHIIYNYRQRRSSVTFSPASQTQILFDRIDYTVKRRAAVVRRFPKLRKDFDLHFLNMMLFLSRDPATSKESTTQIRRHLASYFREKGHTAPEISMIPALLKLYFPSRSRNRHTSAPDINSLFE